MIYTPPIEQSDWSEFTSHGTIIDIDPETHLQASKYGIFYVCVGGGGW